MQHLIPQLQIQTSSQTQCVLLVGVWCAPQLAQRKVWEEMQQALQPVQKQPSDWKWDLTQVVRLDHTGAQLLWNIWGRQWPAQVALMPAQRTMIERAQRWSLAVPAQDKFQLAQSMQPIQRAIVAVGQHLIDAVRMLGQLLLDVIKLIQHPRQAPWRDISGHLYHFGATALPITAMVGFLIGVVLAYLMSQQLRQLGANVFIVNILGMALIRELGPVLAAILIAGRSGSAITAQLGVMRVTEELDAMRVMGIAKGFRLVLPRALAMLIAMPLISIWTTVAALLGGMLAAELSMGLSPAYFVSALPNAVKISNLWLATGKAAVFGLFIALIGCHYGLRVKPNTQSLGEGTTASVVTSITMVIVVDAMFAVAFKNVGL